MAGKGDLLRPNSTTREERQLRDGYMNGNLDLHTFHRRYQKLMEQGLIQRNGRVIKKD